jgi:hypothetical protein
MIPLDHFNNTNFYFFVGSEAGPSSTIPLQQAHSTMVPNTMIIPTGNKVASQPPIGTPHPSGQIPSLPLGYNALNSSIPIPTPIPSGASGVFTPLGYNVVSSSILTPSQFLSGGSYPPFIGGSRPSGSTTFGVSTPLFTSGYQIPIGGKYNLGGKTQFGGQTQIGASSSPTGQPPLGGYNPQYGQNIPTSLAQYWNLLFQGNPQSSGGKQPQVSSFIPPSSGQSYLHSSNPIWGLNFQSSVPPQGNIPNQYNPMGYTPLHTRLNLLGPSPHILVAYGPTSLLMGLPPKVTSILL